jgi:alpha-tubulin suppressor-like RCC1 family protein
MWAVVRRQSWLVVSFSIVALVLAVPVTLVGATPTQTGAVTGSRVIGWGSLGQPALTEIPPGLNATAVAAGAWHSLALRSDGTVAAWGCREDDDPRCDVPSGLSGVVAIAAGEYGSTALRRDGTVVTWPDPYVPAGVRNVVAIGDRVAVRRDGVVFEWWYDGTFQRHDVGGVAVSGPVYGQSLLVLRRDGTVLDLRGFAVPPQVRDVVAVSAGSANLALRRDGTVVAWGCSYHEACLVPPGLSGVVSISAGDNGLNLAVTDDGELVAWGHSIGWGEMDVPPLQRVQSVDAGGVHALAVLGPAVVVTGNATSLPPADRALVRRLTASGWGVATLDDDALTAPASTGVLEGASAVVVSSSVNTSLGTFVTALGTLDTPVVVSEPYLANRLGLVEVGQAGEVSGQTVTRVWGDHQLTGSLDPGDHVVTTAATTFNWFRPVASAIVAATQPGTGRAEIFGVEKGAGLVTGVAAARRVGFLLGYSAPRVATGDGWRLFDAAVEWAAGTRYAPAATSASNPNVAAWGCPPGEAKCQVPPDLRDVAALAGGEFHSLALRRDGTVVAWGENFDGQSDVPTGLTGVTAIAAGATHSLALKRDGTVVAWGDETNRVPDGLSGVVAIAAAACRDGDCEQWGSAGFSVAVRADGSVVAWGHNDYGQTNVPPGLADVVSVAAGRTFTLGLKRNGTVVAWGACGDLGGCDAFDGARDVVAVAAGGYYGLALQRDGTVIGWPGGPLTGVTKIAAGYWGTLAVRSDGRVVTAGCPDWDTANCLPPPGLRHVTGLAAGVSHSLAAFDVEPVLVTGDAANVPRPDRILVQQLAAGGRRVRVIDDDAVGTEAGAMALSTANVVVISSSVDPSLPSWAKVLKPLAIPVVLLEPYLAKTLGLAYAGNAGEQTGQRTTRVWGAHPLTGGLSPGVHTVTTAATTFGWVQPVPSAVVAATQPGAARAAIFGLERGAALASGVAANRRVGFFFTYPTPPLTTTTGWRLFDAAVDWAAAPT